MNELDDTKAGRMTVAWFFWPWIGDGQCGKKGKVDLGFGRSLQNGISETKARKYEQKIRRMGAKGKTRRERIWMARTRISFSEQEVKY